VKKAVGRGWLGRVATEKEEGDSFFPREISAREGRGTLAPDEAFGKKKVFAKEGAFRLGGEGNGERRKTSYEKDPSSSKKKGGFVWEREKASVEGVAYL